MLMILEAIKQRELFLTGTKMALHNLEGMCKYGQAYITLKTRQITECLRQTRRLTTERTYSKQLKVSLEKLA